MNVLKLLQGLYQSLSATFAAIPGLAMLTTGLGAPPGLSWLFGGLAIALGTILFLALVVNRKSLRRMRFFRLNRYVASCISIALITAVLYSAIYGWCVRSSTKPEFMSDPIYLPIVTSGDPSRIINEVGGRQDALNEFGPLDMSDALSDMPWSGVLYAVTTLLLLSLFLACILSLTTAFGMLGLREVEG